jgi:ankyrin repeat protein
MTSTRACAATVLLGSFLWATPAAAADPDRRLVEAAKRQDRATVKTLIAQRADVKAVQADGAGPLHWAAHWDDVEMAGWLIDAGADVNVRNDLGVSPLLIASTNASGAMVERLLAAGANPNASSVGGESPLLVASRAGNAAVVKALLAKGAQADATEPVRGQTPLMWAAANRRADVVRVLVQAGANIHARSTVVPREYQTGSRYVAYDDVRFVVKVDDGGFTPLLFAARSGDATTADLLLAAGATLDEPAPTGASALVIAAHSGNHEVAMLLLERGADPNAAGAGYTALHAAVLRGDVRLVETLIARGAKVDAPLERGTPVRRYSQDYAFSADLIGATPFWLAARYGDVPILRALAGAGANTRFVMTDGSNALLAAVAASSGFGSGDRRERYLTPVEIAAKVESDEERVTLEAAKLALALGSDINSVNRNGDSALHLAATQGLVTVVQFLAEYGAALDLKNKRGMTPLGAALQRQRGEGGVQIPDDRREAAAALLKKLGAPE